MAGLRSTGSCRTTSPLPQLDRKRSSAILPCILAGLAILGSSEASAAKTSDGPPAEFGAIATPRFGCPRIAGVYAWPPLGLPEPASGSARRMPFRQIAGLSLHDPAYLWLAQPDADKHLMLRTIAVPGEAEVIGLSNRGWRGRKLANSEHHCRRGWLIIDEHEHPRPDADASHGGATTVGFRIAPLADGSLAIGHWVRVSGRKGSISWSDAHIADLPAGDVVMWHWARLRRVADDGSTVEVDYSVTPASRR
jgi:hypothetical protein